MRLSKHSRWNRIMASPIASSMTPDRLVKRPILIIGCARSGTTMLGNLLAEHPDLALWHELRMIWMHGHAYNDHDELRAHDLTPKIARFIDRKLYAYLKQSGRSRLGDKTPSNCYRIPFIHAMYPDCRIINIIRDGRGVVRSMQKLRHSRPDAIGRRLRKRLVHTPIREWPAYLPRFYRTMQSRLLGKPLQRWGPLPDGWRAWADMPQHLRLAEQWRAAVHASVRDGRALPAENYMEIKYEALISEPHNVIRSVMDFAELPLSQDVLNRASTTIDPSRANRWSDILTTEQASDIEAHLAPILRELGYCSIGAAE